MPDQYITVSLCGNRFCWYRGRTHRCNNIYLIIDKLERRYRQKCHDVDCRCGSPWFAIPAQHFDQSGVFAASGPDTSSAAAAPGATPQVRLLLDYSPPVGPPRDTTIDDDRPRGQNLNDFSGPAERHKCIYIYKHIVYTYRERVRVAVRADTFQTPLAEAASVYEHGAPPHLCTNSEVIYATATSDAHISWKESINDLEVVYATMPSKACISWRKA